MCVLLIVGCCSVLLAGDVVSGAVISDATEGGPGEMFEVTTGNYKQLPSTYYEIRNGLTHVDIKDLPPYNMTERSVYTYLSTVWGSNRTVRIIFQEFDLNPKSLLYIYDGGNVSAPGSVWTHNSPLPVYSSTGTQLFMVFKTGQDAENKHLGFVADVQFIEDTTWKNPPMTGFCAPLLPSVDYGFNYSLANIVIATEKSNSQAFCSYTSHVGSEGILVASNDPAIELDVRDFPSGAVGRRVLPIQNGSADIFHIVGFNLTNADRGFQLQLTMDITNLAQRVIIVAGKLDEDLVNELLMIEVQKPTASPDWKCPYKTCSAHNECPNFRAPCWYNPDREHFDGSCDLTVAHPEAYAHCAGDNHCYNTQLDRCDGFQDCADGTDEDGCATDSTENPEMETGSTEETPHNFQTTCTAAPENDDITAAGETSSDAKAIYIPIIVILIIIFVVIISVWKRDLIREWWNRICHRRERPEVSYIVLGERD